MWQRARSTSKASFDSLWRLADKVGAPANRLSNKLGSEAFWPTTLEKESDKAARILRSFCKDGFYEEDRSHIVDENAQDQDGPQDGPKKRYSKVLKRIPADVIRNAKGLAVFTTMRTGLWVSGAGGSGILVAKLPDGKWSPPSGILLHTAGVGFLVGIDIYDCVMVLNTDEAVSAFCKVRCTVGGEMSAVAGPIGIGGVLDSEVHKRQAPIFTYLKSRGFYAGVQLDGTIIIERSDENERFYGKKVPAADILAGKASNASIETQRLGQTIKLAQGDTDIDPSMLPIEAAPSEFDIASGQVFGVPDRNDPDPYGFMALEQVGLSVREAGTHKPASRDSFQFMPSPTSPLFSAFNPAGSKRTSLDLDSRRSSWRTSMTDRSALMTDIATQTEIDSVPSLPPALPPRPQSATFVASMADIPEVETIDQKMSKHSTTQPADPTPPQELEESTIAPHIEVADTADMQTQATEPAVSAREPVASAGEPETTERVIETTERAIETTERAIETTERAIETTERAIETTRKTLQTVDLEQPHEVDQHATRELNLAPRADDRDADADDEDSEEEDDDDDDDVIFHEVIQASAPRIVTASPQVITKARLVTVTKPPPPMLPSRNPNRNRGAKESPPAVTDLASDMQQSLRRPRSVSQGSSVYSLPKDDIPSSAKGTESLASVSSTEHGESAQTSSNKASVEVTKEDSPVKQKATVAI